MHVAEGGHLLFFIGFIAKHLFAFTHRGVALSFIR